MTTPTRPPTLFARRCTLALAGLLSLNPGMAAHAAGPAGNNPLEAPPTLRGDDASDDASDDRMDRRASDDTLPRRSRSDAATDAPGLAPRAGNPDWRVGLHLAPPPGDRPASATLAQRAVVVTMSRSF